VIVVETLASDFVPILKDSLIALGRVFPVPSSITPGAAFVSFDVAIGNLKTRPGSEIRNQTHRKDSSACLSAALITPLSTVCWRSEQLSSSNVARLSFKLVPPFIVKGVNGLGYCINLGRTGNFAGSSDDA